MKKISWAFVLSFGLALGLLAAKPVPQAKPEELIARQLMICPSGNPVLRVFYGKDPEHINLLEFTLMDETVFAALVFDITKEERPLTDLFIKDEAGKVQHFTGKTGQEIVEQAKEAIGGPCDVADRIYLKRESI